MNKNSNLESVADLILCLSAAAAGGGMDGQTLGNALLAVHDQLENIINAGYTKTQNEAA